MTMVFFELRLRSWAPPIDELLARGWSRLPIVICLQFLIFFFEFLKIMLHSWKVSLFIEGSRVLARGVVCARALSGMVMRLSSICWWLRQLVMTMLMMKTGHVDDRDDHRGHHHGADQSSINLITELNAFLYFRPYVLLMCFLYVFLCESSS